MIGLDVVGEHETTTLCPRTGADSRRVSPRCRRLSCAVWCFASICRAGPARALTCSAKASCLDFLRDEARRSDRPLSWPATPSPRPRARPARRWRHRLNRRPRGRPGPGRGHRRRAQDQHQKERQPRGKNSPTTSRCLPLASMKRMAAARRYWAASAASTGSGSRPPTPMNRTISAAPINSRPATMNASR